MSLILEPSNLMLCLMYYNSTTCAHFNTSGGNPLLLRTSPYMLGASGAVNAIATLSIAVNPGTTLYIYGILPVPAALFGFVYIVYTSYKAFDPNDRGQVAHAGHFGGVVLGLITALALRGSRRY